VLTGAAASLLALGQLALLGFSGGGAPPLDQAASPPSAVTVSMTAVNDGHAVSLLDPAHPVWAHLAPTGAVTDVTATVNLEGSPIHQWDAHLDAPDAFQGIAPVDCRGDEEAPPHQVSCHFKVQVASGVNRLLFHFSADHGKVDVEAEGSLMGGQFDWDAGWEVLDATGHWSAITRQQPVLLPATLTSALRYVVTNTGDIPFRVTNGCDHRVIPAGAELVCLERGVRSVQSLARVYHELVKVKDAVGATAEPDILASIRSFAGVFDLETPSVTVGQDVVVTASGLPRDAPFALQYRLDGESVLVGTTTRRPGSARFSFALPAMPPGTVHLTVIHNGLAIASLPVEVTVVPRAAPDPPPAWLLPAVVVASVVAVAGGVLLVLGVRRHRRRRSLAA
jgi:hypothetical protein